ncbi:MAG: hypothetical protein BWK79_00760 [Beggiatoa sp. IS2]|nr:MAG: hypothetical protein BWK79_00760 [Beggiatoa sp. IS2]
MSNAASAEKNLESMTNPSEEEDFKVLPPIVESEQVDEAVNRPTPPPAKSAVTEAAVIKLITEGVAAQETEYTREIEDFLKVGSITLKERMLLDTHLRESDLDREQADTIEHEIRARFNLKPRSWTKEYRNSCHALKKQSPHRIPKQDLTHLYDTYVRSQRVPKDKAEEISSLLGVKPERTWIYHWIATVIGGIVLAVIILTQIPMPDIVKPTGEVSGIRSNYRQGDIVKLSLNATDDKELQRIAFNVKEAPNTIKESWKVIGRESSKEIQFSTKDWLTGKEYPYVLTVTDAGGNIFEQKGSFRVDETTPPFARIDNMVGHYTAGDKVVFSVEVNDNEALKTLTLVVDNSPVKEMWNITGKETKQSGVFSTKDWKAGIYTVTLTATDVAGNSATDIKNFILAGKIESIPSVTPAAGVSITTPPASPKVETPVAPAVPATEGTKTVAELLQECKAHHEANRLLTGKEGNAFACYKQVLAQDPNNTEAKGGLDKMTTDYQKLVEDALTAGQLRKAQQMVERLRTVNPNAPALPKLKQRVAALEKQVMEKQAVTPESAATQETPAPPKNPPKPKPTPAKPTPPPSDNDPVVGPQLY